MLLVVLLATVMLGATNAAPAQAADATIGFDELAPGTTVTNQYAARFGVSFSGGGGFTTVATKKSWSRSPDNVLLLRGACGEVCESFVHISFAAPVSHVRVYVTDWRCNSGTTLFEMDAYDQNGTKYTSMIYARACSFFRPLSVSAQGGSASIAAVNIYEANGSAPYLALDDVSFGPAVSSTLPDFSLSPASRQVAVAAGGTVSVPITLNRYNQSSGPTDFTLGATPKGVSATVTPMQDSMGDGSTATVTFVATAAAPATSQFPVTITGAPGSVSAGSAAHTLTIPLTVQAVYGLRVQGIEVTQGVQTFTLPQRNPFFPTMPAIYTGVQLISNMPTIVRVFADAPHALPGGLTATSAHLTVYDKNGTRWAPHSARCRVPRCYSTAAPSACRARSATARSAASTSACRRAGCRELPR